MENEMMGWNLVTWIAFDFQQSQYLTINPSKWRCQPCSIHEKVIECNHHLHTCSVCTGDPWCWSREHWRDWMHDNGCNPWFTGDQLSVSKNLCGRLIRNNTICFSWILPLCAESFQDDASGSASIMSQALC